MRALCDGANVKVWLGEEGGGMELILETSAAPTTSPARLVLQAPENKTIHVDDIQVIGGSLSNTPTTFACNTGNELTSMTRLGVTTTYTYDAWGRMTAKSAGAASASYYWHYRGKITRVSSSFAGEGTVSLTYTGAGKLHERTVGSDTVRYRWRSGYKMASAEDPGGTLLRTYIGSLRAHVTGSNPALGTYHCRFSDHLGSLAR